MDLKLQNITHIFKNVRTRSIIIVTLLILAVGLVLGVGRLMNKTPAANSSVQLKDSPNIQSIPGGLDQSPSAQYQSLQQQQNLQQAAIAAKTGASAIPTLLDTSQFNQAQNPQVGNSSCSSCCCCNASNSPGANQTFSRSAALLQPSQLRSGTLVYDTQGNVIGRLGADGKVRNKDGEIIGTVGPDGLVRAADGSVLGSAAVSAVGDPVYDASGHLIGHVSADGQVRDEQGRVIGKVSADGTVRDLLKGGVIGRAVNPKALTDSGAGTPIYDAQGRLLGTVSGDGKVRDAQGKVIGEVGADGIVRDANGKTIGRAYLGGLVKSTSVIPGSPVYDKQGKLIGTVGNDGRVRDAQGKVIGRLGRDGRVYGLDQQVLGRVGSTAPGTPVYDMQGHLVGTVGSDGIVRDSQGLAIAKLGADGTARDSQGNPLGSTTPPPSAASQFTRAASPLDNTPGQASVSLLPTNTASNPNPELQAILDRQAQQISAQKAEQLQQQMQSSMSTQASQLFVAWASPTQQYVAAVPAISTNQLSGGAGANGGLSAVSTAAPPAVKAGTIMYAVLLTSVNSDEPGPVLAEIVQGKFKGARLLGSLSNQGKKVLLSFNTLTLPKLSQSVAINTVAIDETTARTALSSYTNNHYWLRYGTLFASAFLQGYGQSFLNAGSPFAGSVIINPNIQPQPNLKPRDRVFVGLGQVGLQYASALGSIFSTPPTVHVYSGTPMGILFLSDLAALPAE